MRRTGASEDLMNDFTNVSFTEEDLTAAKGKLEELRSQLKFLVSLEKKQRRNGQKMGQSGKGFVGAMLEVANSHPEILPRKFNQESFTKSAGLYDRLLGLILEIQALSQKGLDTLQMLGILQMKDANRVYGNLQDATEDDNSLRPTLDRVKVYYQKRNLKDENGGNGVVEKEVAAVGN